MNNEQSAQHTGVLKFRKKPVVIEAIQFKYYNIEQVLSFAGKAIVSEEREGIGAVGYFIKTLEGNSYILSKNDWIIKGVNGEFYPCKPDIFERTYESAAGSQVSAQPKDKGRIKQLEDAYAGQAKYIGQLTERIKELTAQPKQQGEETQRIIRRKLAQCDAERLALKDRVTELQSTHPIAVDQQRWISIEEKPESSDETVLGLDENGTPYTVFYTNGHEIDSEDFDESVPTEEHDGAHYMKAGWYVFYVARDIVLWQRIIKPTAPSSQQQP